MIPKTPRFESKKLRDAARDAACVMCGNDAPGVVVLAHLAFKDGGMATKSPDHQGGHLCNANSQLGFIRAIDPQMGCHQYADGEGRDDIEFKFIALTRTLARLFNNGTIEVK